MAAIARLVLLANELPFSASARHTPVKHIQSEVLNEIQATYWSKLVAVAADPDPVSLHPAVTLWYSQHLVLVPHWPHPVPVYADQSLYHTLFGFERIPARVLRGGHDMIGEL